MEAKPVLDLSTFSKKEKKEKKEYFTRKELRIFPVFGTFR